MRDWQQQEHAERQARRAEKTTSHDLISIDCTPLPNNAGYGWGGTCRCGCVFGATGRELEARNEIITEHRKHVALIRTCPHLGAEGVETTLGDLVGWICTDCGDEILRPAATWGRMSPWSAS
jgi:hypothetical protein